VRPGGVWVVGQFETVGFCSPASAASNASASASNASASRKRASAFPFRFAARSRSLSGSGTCRFRTSPPLHRMRPVSSTVRETARQKNEGPRKVANPRGFECNRLLTTVSSSATGAQMATEAGCRWRDNASTCCGTLESRSTYFSMIGSPKPKTKWLPCQ
jgi:hypothetical protein